MDCKHERKKCVNNVMFCADCGARIEPTKHAEEKPERKIGFANDTEAEAPKKRRTAKKKGE